MSSFGVVRRLLGWFGEWNFGQCWILRQWRVQTDQILGTWTPFSSYSHSQEPLHPSWTSCSRLAWAAYSAGPDCWGFGGGRCWHRHQGICWGRFAGPPTPDRSHGSPKPHRSCWIAFTLKFGSINVQWHRLWFGLRGVNLEPRGQSTSPFVALRWLRARFKRASPPSAGFPNQDQHPPPTRPVSSPAYLCWHANSSLHQLAVLQSSSSAAFRSRPRSSILEKAGGGPGRGRGRREEAAGWC